MRVVLPEPAKPVIIVIGVRMRDGGVAVAILAGWLILTEVECA